MSSEYVIEVRDLKKKFKVYFDKGKMLKERVLFAKRNRYEEKWVLNGVSFKVKKGEAVGLIGHNGCGKSTMLKMLTKIMYPDGGEIIMNGRVSSLIELGAGFHPDMSGRENIYINASIFGLSHAEIEKRIEDIIAFSELEKYIDNPVRTYSSGMYMRLAFSVAINVDADILLIDEILAVGDVNFQDKCFKKLMDIKNQGTTIVLVSHSMAQIEAICDRCIWIHDGLKRAEGPAVEVDAAYLNYMIARREEKVKRQIVEKSAEPGTEDVQIEDENSPDINTDEFLKEARAIKAGTYDAIFDANFYYNAYPDVAKAIGRDPAALLSHFLNEGMGEGRQGSPEFNCDIYMSNYKDLRDAWGANKKNYYLHYKEYGKAENRVAHRYLVTNNDYSSVFNAQYYMNHYEDVLEDSGGDADRAFAHFITFGMKEGRQGCAEFNPYIYRSNYPVLYATVREDMEQYFGHYANVGKKEGWNGQRRLLDVNK